MNLGALASILGDTIEVLDYFKYASPVSTPLAVNSGKLLSFGGQECDLPSEPIRFSRDTRSDNDLQSPAFPVAITQNLDDRLQTLEKQFLDVDTELRRRFGEQSYSVDRSEQVLGAIQRLRWAISRSPVVNPFPVCSEDIAETER